MPGGSPRTFVEPRGDAPTDPFLKWAGGKRLLRDAILDYVPAPEDGRRYFEPFVGGGAIFFALRPSASILSDVNDALIEAFGAVRDDVENVIRHLRAKKYSKKEYYETRAARPRTKAARAARFVYLNKTCFNGLYRENFRGEFNVPIGRHDRRTLVICDEDQLRSASCALQGVELVSGDFGRVLARARAGDVVYLDPPYTVAHSNNGFIEYNARVFGWDDQSRLAEAARRLVERGVHVTVSNAFHPSILDLYEPCGLFEAVEIERWSTMASSSRRRMPTKEVLFVGSP